MRQLAFNTGLWSLAIFLAGIGFQFVQAWLGTDTVVSVVVPWLIVGILNDQLNMWLLLGMVKLQHGEKVNLLEAWRSNLWAAGINIAIISMGGGIPGLCGHTV